MVAAGRGGAHPVFGLKVHLLLHEAGEGGEVAPLRRLAKSFPWLQGLHRLAKSLLRLRGAAIHHHRSKGAHHRSKGARRVRVAGRAG